MATRVESLFCLMVFLSSFESPASGDSADHKSGYLPFARNSRPSDPRSYRRDDFKKSVKPLSPRSNHNLRLSSLFEKGLLSILGVDSRPKRARETVIPALMMELYWERVSMAGQSEGTQKPAHRRNSYRQHYQQSTADIIRSFFETGTDRGNLTESDHQTALYFDVADISKEEKLRGAELIVHQRCLRRDNDSEPDLRLRRFRLTVFQVTRGAKRASAGGAGSRRLLDSRVVANSHCDRTLAFDVRSAVAQWIHSPSSNLGLILKWTTTGSDVIFPVVAGDSLASRPILISYSDSLKSPKPEETTSPAAVRGASSPVPRLTKRSTGKRSRSKGVGESKECHRSDLYVDFSDIGWDDWIAAPVGYNAHYCQGDCPTFLHDYVNYTNHAVIQAFVHSADPEAAPRPCCVPTKLSTIPMLYVDSTGRVILKNYEDMVVKACGCR